ncbi:hypothetical protein AAVH_26533 [Aphelenchoides avenae]|nr:hypothetical protein AAVH_26533 [Aphelenchus avenae]
MVLCTLVILAICAVHIAASGDVCADGQFVGERFVDSFGYFGCEPVRIAGLLVKVEKHGVQAVQNFEGGRVVYSTLPGGDDKDPTTKGAFPPCAVVRLECEPSFEPAQTATQLTCKNTSNERESWWAFGVGAGGSFEVEFFEGCERFRKGWFHFLADFSLG